MVIAEAMACGRAVITSGSGGAAELIDAGVDALTHVPGDAEDLSRCIVQLAGDAELRRQLGSRARAAARRRFDSERLAREVVAVYEAIADEPRIARITRPLAVAVRGVAVGHRRILHRQPDCDPSVVVSAGDARHSVLCPGCVVRHLDSPAGVVGVRQRQAQPRASRADLAGRRRSSTPRRWCCIRLRARPLPASRRSCCMCR